VIIVSQGGVGFNQIGETDGMEIIRGKDPSQGFGLAITKADKAVVVGIYSNEVTVKQILEEIIKKLVMKDKLYRMPDDNNLLIFQGLPKL